MSPDTPRRHLLGIVWSFVHGIRTMIRGGAVVGRRIVKNKLVGERKVCISLLEQSTVH